MNTLNFRQRPPFIMIIKEYRVTLPMTVEEYQVRMIMNIELKFYAK